MLAHGKQATYEECLNILNISFYTIYIKKAEK